MTEDQDEESSDHPEFSRDWDADASSHSEVSEYPYAEANVHFEVPGVGSRYYVNT